MVKIDPKKIYAHENGRSSKPDFSMVHCAQLINNFLLKKTEELQNAIQDFLPKKKKLDQKKGRTRTSKVGNSKR